MTRASGEPALLLRAFTRSLRRLLSARILWLGVKALLAALVLIVVLWLLINGLFSWWLWPWWQGLMADAWAGWLGSPWSHWGGSVLFAVLVGLVLALLVAPLSALMAGQLIDNVAAMIEHEDYPGVPSGQALPLWQSLKVSLRFFGWSLICNLLALPVLLVPIVNVVVFFGLNGYLLGREYFEFAAARTRSLPEAHACYRRYRHSVFAGGVLIACMVAIPLVNLMTPLFAAVMMVHLYQLLAAREREHPAVPAP